MSVATVVSISASSNALPTRFARIVAPSAPDDDLADAGAGHPAGLDEPGAVARGAREHGWVERRDQPLLREPVLKRADRVVLAGRERPRGRVRVVRLRRDHRRSADRCVPSVSARGRT